MELVVGARTYRIVAVRRDTAWIAHAEEAATGARFGIDVSGDSEPEARGRLEEWLRWQDEHMAALTLLQHAERVYHRAMTDAAFTAGDRAVAAGPLESVNRARDALDTVRARRPNL